MKILRTLLGIAATIVVSGCAVGNKHHYHDVVAAIPVSGDADVTVGVIDKRPYILNGDKKPNFVGLQRGGYGIPFDVTTETGKPLSIDMSTSIAHSLNARGF